MILRIYVTALLGYFLAVGLWAGCDSTGAGSNGEPATNDPAETLETGVIVGQVTDPFAGTISGVDVSLSHEGEVAQTTRTTTQGRFIFREIPLGRYTVEARREGFKPAQAFGFAVGVIDTARIQIQLEAEAQASGGVLRSAVLDYTDTTMEFEADLFIAGESGEVIGGLQAANFSIAEVRAGSATLQFSQAGLTLQTQTSLGPYSAALLFDQSGSISSTDPNDACVQSSKVFLSALGPGDNVIVAAFSDGNQLPQRPVTIYGDRFTQDGPSYFPTLDTFPALEGGGTPLYIATQALINFTNTHASNANKAVIVFTDGEDTEGGVTINEIARRAKETGVRVFPVGLSSGVNLEVLGELAVRTGGTLMFAADARQLVSLYGTLGNVLRGGTRFYRTTWQVTASRSLFSPGQTFLFQMDVETPERDVMVFVFLEVP